LPASSVTVRSSSSIAAVTPAHLPGVVDVSVINADGRAATLSGGYTYLAPNQPPQVTTTASTTSGVAPLPVGLTATAFDPDGTIAGYKWDFGDGQTSTQAVVSHVYQLPGTYNARVTVTDNVGGTATASTTITVFKPSVRVSYPNGGEILQADTSCIITWSMTGGSPSRQDVSLSLNGGSTWTVLASGLAGSANSYSWRVPRTATTTARIRVRVWDAAGTTIEDTSDRDFAIQKKPIR
jgi:PKD repeat protein